ncbi:hypothetical protein K491DRAFT_780996 [Lophiostoma macrostomum CBS 122681]|uniref:F-box domain-containing protein n=1 Tax=Lophiostoma macrostomum CBS 122681 TaxID=1314788 RepID=A0A6A6T1Y3_9PLEO|nr:hypothetical protein K491DRAFT_780996 [Lophiostoma macrostomum CBS 122681]
MSLVQVERKTDDAAASHTIPAQDTQQLQPRTSFLSLPGELRNYIYQLSVYTNINSAINILQTSQPDLFRSILSPPVFRTSRQVRHETLSYLCANNRFQLLGLRSASEFLTAIGPAGRESLACLSLVLTSLPRHTSAATICISMLKDAKGLKYMRLVFEVGLELEDFSSLQVSILRALYDAVKSIEGLQFSWLLRRNDYEGWANGIDRQEFPRRVEFFKKQATAIFGRGDSVTWAKFNSAERIT